MTKKLIPLKGSMVRNGGTPKDALERMTRLSKSKIGSTAFTAKQPIHSSRIKIESPVVPAEKASIRKGTKLPRSAAHSVGVPAAQPERSQPELSSMIKVDAATVAAAKARGQRGVKPPRELLINDTLSAV